MLKKNVGTLLLSLLMVFMFMPSMTWTALASSSEENNFKYTVMSDGTIEINKYTGSEKVVKIPETIEGKKVTRIGNEAFKNYEIAKKIEIPKSVRSIGESAFDCCTVEEVELPEELTRIEKYAFNYCRNLKKITIPKKVTRIEKFAFAYCMLVKEIRLSEGIKTIGMGAFTDCYKLEKINIINCQVNMHKKYQIRMYILSILLASYDLLNDMICQ